LDEDGGEDVLRVWLAVGVGGGAEVADVTGREGMSEGKVMVVKENRERKKSQRRSNGRKEGNVDAHVGVRPFCRLRLRLDPRISLHRTLQHLMNQLQPLLVLLKIPRGDSRHSLIFRRSPRGVFLVEGRAGRGRRKGRNDADGCGRKGEGRRRGREVGKGEGGWVGGVVVVVEAGVDLGGDRNLERGRGSEGR
jgi:hypothetical protein